MTMPNLKRLTFQVNGYTVIGVTTYCHHISKIVSLAELVTLHPGETSSNVEKLLTRLHIDLKEAYGLELSPNTFINDKGNALDV